jgi:hypothetical protein
MGVGRFARLGYWAALTCGAGAAAYGVASITVVAVAPAALSWESYALFAADYSPWPTMAVLFPPFVVTVAFPLVILAVYATVADERRPFALLTLLLAGAYSAVLGSAYWMQLTNVPWNIVRGAGEEIAPWVIWNPASLFWPLETFAYFVMGLACSFAAMAYTPGDLPRRVRGGLLAMGALGVWFLTTALKDVVFDTETAWTMAWSLSAFVLWVLLFPSVAFGLARWFKHLPRDARPPDGSDLDPSRRQRSWQPT